MPLERAVRIDVGRRLAALALLASASAFAAPSFARDAGEAGASPTRVLASIRPDAGNAALPATVGALADWAYSARDTKGLPFLIVDKPQARLHVFDADGAWRASAPVLLGSARGDDSVPGIGERAIKDIRPHERTTPAGRFVAERGMNANGEDVVWIDYDAAVSMHRVRATNPKERRLERLRTPDIDDNRISYGCINVPKAFYERYVLPIFNAGRAVVYVMPETRSAREQFGLDATMKTGTARERDAGRPGVPPA